MKQKTSLQQQLYTVAFVDLSIKAILDGSTLFRRPEWMDTMFLLIFFGCIGWKFLLQRYSKWMLMLTAVLGFLFVYVSFRMSFFFLLFTFCGVAAMQDVDLKKVLQYTSIVKILLILIHIIPSVVMMIVAPEQIHYFYRNGVQRQDFFLGHPNTFSMYVGWALLEFTYAYYDKMKNFHLFLFWGINFAVYQFTNSNTSFIIATFCYLSLILERKKPDLVAKWYTPVAQYGYMLCAIFFTAITVGYSKMPSGLKALYMMLNDFFTGRLLFGAYVYEQFGIAWLGNPNVALNGKAFFDGYWIDQLVLDNSFIFLLVKYGAIFIPIFAIAFWWLGKDRDKDIAGNLNKIIIIGYIFFAIMENYSVNAGSCFPLLFVGKKIFSADGIQDKKICNNSCKMGQRSKL